MSPSYQDLPASAELLQEHARRYAVFQDQEPVLGVLVHMLAFELGNEAFVVETELLESVDTLGRISRLPRQPPTVVGVVNHRGALVTALDLAVVLGLGRTSLRQDSHLVLARTGQDVTAFVVDRLLSAITLDTGTCQLFPATPEARRSGLVKGVFQHDGRPLVWLDLARAVGRALSTLPDGADPDEASHAPTISGTPPLQSEGAQP